MRLLFYRIPPITLEICVLNLLPKCSYTQGVHQCVLFLEWPIMLQLLYFKLFFYLVIDKYFLECIGQKTVGVNTSKVRCGHLQITITPLPLTKVLYNLAFVILVSFTVLSIILKKKKIKFLCLQGRRKEKHSHSHRGIHSPFFTDSHTHNIYLVFTNKVVLFCLKQSVVSLTHNASLVFSFDFGNIGLCKNNYWWKPERNMHSLKTRISSSKLEKGESWLILLKILT